MKGNDRVLTQTRDALNRVIGGNQSEWARENGVSSSAVNDLLRGATMSAERVNPIRMALGLVEVEERIVVINSGQRIVAAPGYGKRRNPEFRFHCTQSEAQAISEAIESMGFSSFSEWCRAIFEQESVI